MSKNLDDIEKYLNFVSDAREYIYQHFNRNEYKICNASWYTKLEAYIFKRKLYRVFICTTRSSVVRPAFIDKHWPEYPSVFFFDRAVHLLPNGEVSEQSHHYLELGVIPAVFSPKYIYWEEVNE